MGRSHVVAAYVKPDRPVCAPEIDALRDEVEAACGEEVTPARVALIVTERHPFDPENSAGGQAS